MKVRKEITGSKNDNWETPEYILTWIKENIFNFNGYFDPCPLSEKRSIGMKEIEVPKYGEDGETIVSWKKVQKEDFEYILKFDGLSIDWESRNFVNPPYNITDKPKFVKKAFDEYKKGNTSVLLIPATTETQWFHEYLVPYAGIYFIKGRVKFKGFNSKGEYVTNKTGQSGSMLCVLDPNKEPFMKSLEIDHN